MKEEPPDMILGRPVVLEVGFGFDYEGLDVDPGDLGIAKELVFEPFLFLYEVHEDHTDEEVE